jgi:membrane-associated protease RseP (regulator of RpoE activity)
MIFLLLTIAVALLLFYVIVFQLEISGALKFLLVVIEMTAVNQLLIKRYRLSSELGLVLLKSKKGIEIIDGLAMKEKAFNFMADVGTSISYGLLSVVLMRKNVSAASVLVGIVVLAVLSLFVAPVAFAFLLQIIGRESVSTSVGELSTSPDYGFLFFSLMLVAGGLFLFILFGIVFYGITVFKALITTVFLGSDAMARTSPGGTLLLPGVNLPFIEGILALAIVMVVHEGAHAVLSRIARVPILSSGIVLFGIIPIGAFVEPDEKKLMKVEDPKQTRVLVAGPTANLITATVFFIAFMGFFYTTSELREGVLLIEPSDPNQSAEQPPLPPGTLIFRIDGKYMELEDFQSGLGLPADTEIEIVTNKGTIQRMTDANGKLGITFLYLSRETLFSVYREPLLQSIYVLLGLSVALNFVVGAVNILPIPLFDGYRIVDVNIKNKTVVKAISYSALFFFILNFLPLLFR